MRVQKQSSTIDKGKVPGSSFQVKFSNQFVNIKSTLESFQREGKLNKGVIRHILHTEKEVLAEKTARLVSDVPSRLNQSKIRCKG